MRTPHFCVAAALFAVAAPHAAAAQPESIDVAAVGAWSYTGPTGPAFWASRFPYPQCVGGVGSRQSPVDLVATTNAPPLPVTLNYPAGNPAKLVNTGHSVYLYLTNQASLRVADTTFGFSDIHFHVPAEHLVQGTRYAAEIHSVHQHGSNGNRAVLTTFIAEGPHNSAWNLLIAALPGNKGDTISIAPPNLTTLLSLGGLASEPMYSYAGSLTTPECTRNVRFLVRQRPITLSRPQIEALAAAFARNVRPLFPAPSPVVLHRGVP